MIHRDSLLTRGQLPRYLFLHFDGHVVVAIVADSEKRSVGVFDSRPLSQTAAIMRRYKHFFRQRGVRKVTSLSTTVDMQTDGRYNWFAWSRCTSCTGTSLELKSQRRSSKRWTCWRRCTYYLVEYVHVY